MRAVLAVALALGVAACDGAPSCEAVADHVLALVSKSNSKLLVADRAALIENCKAESGSNARMRACIVRATSLEDVKGCELRSALGR